MRGEYRGRASFGAGVVVGVALLAGGYYTLAYFTANLGSTVELAAAGPAMSRHGVRQVKLVHDQGSLTQNCNGACDDVRYSADADKSGYALELRDAAGQCISCGPKRFVAYDPMGLRARWEIGGEDELKVEVRERIGLSAPRTVADARTTSTR